MLELKNKYYYVINSARIYFDRIILVTNEYEISDELTRVDVIKRLYIDNTYIDTDFKHIEYLSTIINSKEILTIEGRYYKFNFDDVIVYIDALTTAEQIKNREYTLKGTSLDKQHRIYKILNKTINAVKLLE